MILKTVNGDNGGDVLGIGETCGWDSIRELRELSLDKLATDTIIMYTIRP